MNKGLLIAMLAGTMLVAPAQAQNLLVNGNFEGSSSGTVTPPGWTNVGHSDGVIAYSAFDTPAYDGAYFYDLGGYGNAFGPAGDGIEQTVATTAGAMYRLTFGLSSEDYLGTSVLNVFIGSQLTSFTIPNTGLQFRKPFITQTIDFTALTGSTTISFIEGQGTGGGNGSNDPLIDGVSFALVGGGGVPEPAAWALMIGGFGMVGSTVRRRKVATKIAFAGSACRD